MVPVDAQLSSVEKNSCSTNSLVCLLALQRRRTLAPSQPKLLLLCQNCSFEPYNTLLPRQRRGEMLAQPGVLLSAGLRIGVLNWIQQVKWGRYKLRAPALFNTEQQNGVFSAIAMSHTVQLAVGKHPEAAVKTLSSGWIIMAVVQDLPLGRVNSRVALKECAPSDVCNSPRFIKSCLLIFEQHMFPLSRHVCMTVYRVADVCVCVVCWCHKAESALPPFPLVSLMVSRHILSIYSILLRWCCCVICCIFHKETQNYLYASSSRAEWEKSSTYVYTLNLYLVPDLRNVSYSSYVSGTLAWWSGWNQFIHFRRPQTVLKDFF